MAGLKATEKQARTKAHRMRDELGLPHDAPVPDLLRTVEAGARVPVAILETMPGDIAGAYLKVADEPLILLNGENHPVRLRFTLAHELCHHCFGDRAQPDTAAGLARPGHWIEVRANRFAAELLMPPAAVDAWAARRDTRELTLEDVLAFGAEFGVSGQAAFYRLTSCGVLADAERAERIKAELDDEARLTWFAVTPYEDSLLAAVQSLPRLPDRARHSIFGAVGRGELDAGDAAAQLGRPREALSRALGAVGLLPPA